MRWRAMVYWSLPVIMGCLRFGLAVLGGEDPAAALPVGDGDVTGEVAGRCGPGGPGG